MAHRATSWVQGLGREPEGEAWGAADCRGGGDPRRVEGKTGGLQGRWSARGQTWIVCGWQRAGHPDHQAP